MKHFFAKLAPILDGVGKGIIIASAVTGSVDPPLQPLLAQIAQIVGQADAAGKLLTDEQLVSIGQAVGTLHALNAAAAK